MTGCQNDKFWHPVFGTCFGYDWLNFLPDFEYCGPSRFEVILHRN